MENKLECRRVARNGDSIQKESVILAHFPEEVITKILVWLPVKSLLRFRCVSKSFCTLIDSHYFIYLHLNTSARNRTRDLKLIFLEKQLISTNYNLAKLRVSDLDNDLIEKSPAEKYWGKWPTIQVYGYCNGVFLVLVNSFLLALWNPSTQKHRTLPRCPFGNSPCPYNMGLGYDSTRDDYKIVLIANVGTYENPQGFHVWIFGLRSNSWRMVPTDFFPKEGSFLSFGYFAHGNLYWKCILDGNDFYSQDIVAFDVSKETFSLVTQPLYPTKGELTGLQVLDGYLCSSFISELGELALLYVRKKDGADFTWSILYSITTAQLPPFLKMDHFRFVVVLGYSKKGDKIMLYLDFQYMISYDLNEKSFRTTTVTSLINDDGLVEPCFESLVSVGD